MNLAIFGGSFDPPHIGHLQIIQQISSLDIEHLVVVVAYKNRLKNHSRFSSNKRFAWMQILLSQMCNSQNIHNVLIECSDYEILQQKATPMLLTIKHFKEKYNPAKIYCVIGEDNFLLLNKWFHINELALLVEFVVIERTSSVINYQDSQNTFSQYMATQDITFYKNPTSALSRKKLLEFQKIYNLKACFMSCIHTISSSDIMSDFSRFQEYIPFAIRKNVEREYCKIFAKG